MKKESSHSIAGLCSVLTGNNDMVSPAFRTISVITTSTTTIITPMGG